MLIKFNTYKDRVLFINEDAYEYKNMMGFPAFLKEGPFFYVPAKVHIVYNVVSRLRKAFKKIAIDKDVLEFMNLEMNLLALPDSFKYVTSPKDYQDIALRYLYTVGSGGLLLDAGLGKTKVVLDYISLMKFKLSLVVAPLPLLFVWGDEVSIHRPDLTIHLVETTNWEKEWELGKDKNIICMNYSKATIFKDQLKKCKFEFLHLDEFLIKDPKTVRTQSIIELSKGIPYKCGGSGTLINNSLLDMFAPIRFLEPSLVGTSFTNFKNRHTIKNPRDLRMVVGTTKVEEARSVLESCCVVMHKDEWLKDLPKQKFEDIYVQLGDDQREFYSSLSRNYIALIDNMTVEVDNALVMLSKLYQVSQGMIYIGEKTEEDSEEVLELLAEESKKKKKDIRHTRFFKSQPKIDALLELVNGKAKNKRSIIWFNLSAEYTLISEALTKAGYKFLSIKGGTKDVGKIVREFNNNPSIKYLLAQSKSVNYGVTVLGTTMEKLENSNFEIFPNISPGVYTEIFYSCNFSLEVYLQQCARIHRLGQTNECSYYRIFANTSVEHRIRKALDDKLSIRREMLIDIAESMREELE